MGDSTKRNFKAMLAEAKLPERIVPICLRGDLVAEHEAAERELEREQTKVADSLEGNPAANALAERIEQLEEQMRGGLVDFRFRALPRHQWRALLAEHPPRKVQNDDGEQVVHEEDRYVGVNVETFYGAVQRACLVEPEMDDDDWSALLDTITDRQYDALSEAAWKVNRGDVDIPFSRAASRTMRDSAGE